MADAFRVSVPFTRKDPETEQPIEYVMGTLVTHPARLQDILGSEYAAYGHKIILPDDHHAVLPHLPDDHPAKRAFVEGVQEGWNPDGRKEDEAVHRAFARKPSPVSEPVAEQP